MSDNYLILAGLALDLYNGRAKTCPLHRERAIGLITDGFHQCNPIHSGLVSKNAQHLTVAKMTKDHFYSRKKCARKIFEMMEAGASIEELYDFIILSCSVHYVTKRENLDLIPFQKNAKDYPTWQEQYAAAGIELVPYVKKNTRKYVYIINGIEYKSAMEASISNSCTVQDVYNRCKSKTSRFANWIREDII